ncbi:hypothetical protein N7G274_007503 [Stereocaulon virgatum]|uniref:Uncharacterized protein n=1 Tax=Stereocaulon virgatum TaxID=373712 RepID=A0ABR4A107_9LECA
MLPTFIDLPPEMRNIVYKLLFVSRHPDNAITPDPVGSRKSNGPFVWRIGAPDSLPLLRTCRQIHDEASSILYGKNIFLFSDAPHGQRTFEVPGFGQTLRWCDYVTMYGFLSRIGCENRAKILRLRLEFLTFNYITYADEEVGRERSDQSFRGGGAHVVGDALDLLSSKHSLSQVEFQFDSQHCVGFYAYVALCVDTKNKLRTRLARLQGIGEVKCIVMKKRGLPRIIPSGLENDQLTWRLQDMTTRWYEEAQSGFLRLKTQMEYKPRYTREVMDWALRWQQEWSSIMNAVAEPTMPPPALT